MFAIEMKNMVRFIKNSRTIQLFLMADDDDNRETKHEGESVEDPEAPVGRALYLVVYENGQVDDTVGQGNGKHHQYHQQPNKFSTHICNEEQILFCKIYAIYLQNKTLLDWKFKVQPTGDCEGDAQTQPPTNIPDFVYQDSGDLHYSRQAASHCWGSWWQ
jgi:hypothetical protein